MGKNIARTTTLLPDETVVVTSTTVRYKLNKEEKYRSMNWDDITEIEYIVRQEMAKQADLSLRVMLLPEDYEEALNG